MNGANPVIVCSYLCNGTRTSPFITGSAAVCADKMYILNNLNGATGFDWDQSANLSPASADGGTTYTVSANGEGDGFAQVILYGACGNSNPFVKNIDVGAATAAAIIQFPDRAAFVPTSMHTTLQMICIVNILFLVRAN